MKFVVKRLFGPHNCKINVQAISRRGKNKNRDEI